MKSHHLLAFDYGKKFIGVAVGSTTSGSAEGITTIQTAGRLPDWRQIDRLIDQWSPAALVVGLPLNMDGTDTGATKMARKFGENLKSRYNLPVHMVDERLSTVAAKNNLTEVGVSLKRSNKSKIDMHAAVIILQHFLDEPPATHND